MNNWIHDGWLPGFIDFCQMVVFAFWWLIATGIAAGVIFLFVLMVVSAVDQ